MKKALVTGGSGFLGKAMHRYLADNGYDAYNFDTGHGTENHIQGSVLNYEEIRAAVSGIDVVFNIAGLLGTTELLDKNIEAIDVNIKGAVNVLEACYHEGVSTVFYPTKPNVWLNTYTITKKAAEDFGKIYSQYKGLDVRMLRWFNAYGPGQKAFPIRKAIPLFINQALANKDIEIWGNGEQKVKLIYSDDLARNSVLYTLKENVDSTVRDTGNNVEMSVNELATLIIKLSKSNSTIKHLPMRLGEDPTEEFPSIPGQTAADILGFEDNTTSAEKGLRATIEYYSQLPSQRRQKILEFYENK